MPNGILPERKEVFAAPPQISLESALGGATATQGAEISNGREAGPVGRSDSKVLLRVDNIHCAFGGVQAVDGASIEVRTGAFLGLIGPNGAGKSTLLDCISGVNRNYKGSVVLADQDVSRMAPHKLARRGLTRSFQVSRLFPHMTVMSNLMSGPYPQKGERLRSVVTRSWRSEESANTQRARALLAEFGLERMANEYCSDLSGGQQRLVELCRAMMSRPTLLLLDEPFAGVSPANRANLIAALRYLWQEHALTVVMVEHRLEVVESLCDSVVVMASGRVAAHGSLEEVRNNQLVLDAYLGRTG
jgi:branched-chain amino acid transport system ATP-binding protein